MGQPLSNIPSTPSEPPRIAKLKRGLVRAIPRFPNNKKTLQQLAQKSIGGVIIDYVNWRSRYVGARPRNIAVEQYAYTDWRWASLSTEIGVFLEKVRRGDDLTPHLSLAPHTRGFTPAALALGASAEDKWSDKDFVLAAQGFHHFHLGITTEASGHVQRTNDLLFAQVARDSLNVIAIFDHSVFEPSSVERHRLWATHEQYTFRDLPPGSIVIGAAITTSAHTLQVVTYAQHCVRTIAAIEPQLDDQNYVREFYEKAGRVAPMNSQFEWIFNHLDLCVGDRKSKTLFTLVQGWN